MRNIRYAIIVILLALSILSTLSCVRKHLVWYDLDAVNIDKDIMSQYGNIVRIAEPLPGKSGRERDIIGEKFRKEEECSRLIVYENDIALSRRDKFSVDAHFSKESGVYYHGKGTLYISSMDGTSPKLNTHEYTLAWPRTVRLYWTTLPLALLALFILLPEIIVLGKSVHKLPQLRKQYITKKYVPMFIKSSLIYGLIIVVSIFLFLAFDYLVSTTNSFQQMQINILGQADVLRIPHPVYHHDLRPNVDVLCRWGPYQYRIITDQYGFKNAAKVEDVDNKHFDVLFIGDSFTEGIGLPYEETFVGMFAAQHPELRIANAGVSSYCPSIYFKKIEYLLKNGFTFDHVIVFVDISDMQDEATHLFDINADLDPKVPKSILHNFRFSRRLYNKILESFVGPKKQEVPSFLIEPDPIVWASRRGNWTYTPDSDALGSIGLDGAIKRSIDAMHRLKLLLDEHAITMTIGVYPWPNQLKNDIKNHRGSTLWREFAANEHCKAFIDVNPFFFDELAKRGFEDVIRTYYFSNDTHFTKEGNSVLFQELENHWIPLVYGSQK